MEKCKKFKFCKFWEHPLFNISEYAFNAQKLGSHPKTPFRFVLVECLFHMIHERTRLTHIHSMCPPPGLETTLPLIFHSLIEVIDWPIYWPYLKVQNLSLKAWVNTACFKTMIRQNMKATDYYFHGQNKYLVSLVTLKDRDCSKLKLLKLQSGSAKVFALPASISS